MWDLDLVCCPGPNGLRRRAYRKRSVNCSHLCSCKRWPIVIPASCLEDSDNVLHLPEHWLWNRNSFCSMNRLEPWMPRFVKSSAAGSDGFTTSCTLRGFLSLMTKKKH